ncbi:MAG: hypothetical protein EZS28_035161, partial [Streblomastix strix]
NSQNQGQPEYSTLSTPAPTVIPQFQVPNILPELSLVCIISKINLPGFVEDLLKGIDKVQNQLQPAFQPIEFSTLVSTVISSESVLTATIVEYGTITILTSNSQLPDIITVCSIDSCSICSVAVIAIAQGTVEPNQLSHYYKITMRK